VLLSQVSWIGYPNTTGVDCVDYRLTDDICDTPDSTQLYSEKLVRLSGVFFNCVNRKICLEVPVSPEPPLFSKGHVTFGSFNNIQKHSTGTKHAWARVLIECENSSMLIKAPSFNNVAAAEYWRGKFLETASDISGYKEEEMRAKLQLVGATATIRDHCKLYNEMDIVLDSWPFSGHITTVEALLMGVPVITLSVPGMRPVP
jgi:predicted O-linked N-acetylglucosamine transferase (SPINDLY family)